MKTLTVVFVASFALGIVWTLGYRTGSLDEGMRQRDKIQTLEARLERFEDPYVFNHARLVAKVTGRDLYQVLTGKR